MRLELGEDVEANLADADDLPPYDEAAAKLLRDRRMVGAALAGSSIGLLFSGNILLAAALGSGAAYATTREGKVGEVSRSLGDKTMEVVDRVRASMREHRVLERAAEAASAASARAAELDERLQLSERGRVAAADIAARMRALDARHHIVERAAAAAASATSAGSPAQGTHQASSTSVALPPADAESAGNDVVLGVPVAPDAAGERLAKAPEYVGN